MLLKALGALILLGFLVGLLLVVFVPVELNKMAQASEWPSRKGVVTVAYARRVNPVNKPAYYRAEIIGTFLDNGERFAITRVRHGEFRFGSGQASAMETVAQYPVGSQVDVYYSPPNPRETILEPRAPRSTMFIALGAGIGLVLLPVVLYACRKKS
jgi:hypothetical protein